MSSEADNAPAKPAIVSGVACGVGPASAQSPARKDLVGLSARWAIEMESGKGRTVRIIGEDGRCYDRSDDGNPNRVNLYSEHDRVLWAQMG
jgi:hypothetical protein